MHKINLQPRKEIFGLGKQRKIHFFELLRLSLSRFAFESLYNILHILTQLIQTSCLVTHFCAQAVFKVTFSNIFATHKTI